MFQHTESQTFPAGSKVRDRLTGDVFTVATGTRGRHYTAIRIDPASDARTMILPTADLEAVDGAGVVAAHAPVSPFSPTAQAIQ